MSAWRGAIRDAAYAGGLLGLRHRIWHAETLTVVTFHRVIARAESAAEQADPTYCMPAPLFADCLTYFRRHYHVITLTQLRESVLHNAPLPPRALLITFDDGWRDNLVTAAPILKSKKLPAIAFLAAEAVVDTQQWWWQEVLLRAFRQKRASWNELWALGGGVGAPGGDPALLLLQQFETISPEQRLRLLAPFASDAASEGRQMLTLGDLPDMVEAGVALGGHGAAHQPLSLMADPASDLARSRQMLAGQLRESGQELDAMSFPHGRYDERCVALARSAGFSLLFTSDACLNRAPGGRPSSLLGRISVETAAITNERGEFAPARLAAWLFHRPVRMLGSPDPGARA